MHNLALALHDAGHTVTGSDDQIFEPSRSRLDQAGILPAEMGWFPEKITKDIDAIVLGMHAHGDNPEMKRAQELGVPIFSYPAYLYEHAKDKTRVVIGGSHGKTTITSMVLHVLQQCGVKADYMVGAQLEGFDRMVKLSDAKIMVLEGDEYLSSTLDKRPKFHLYKGDICLLSGIAWDHFNVFPTFDNYLEQFRIYARQIPSEGCLIYCQADAEVVKVAEDDAVNCRRLPYNTPTYTIDNGVIVEFEGKSHELAVFGQHNLQNMEGARLICEQLGVSGDQFYSAIQSFKGASKRMQTLTETADQIIIKDFAHSPSKLQATIAAAKERFAPGTVLACLELHTYSSINPDFIDQYAGTTDLADEVIVYYDPGTSKMKRLAPLSNEDIFAAFGRSDLKVCSDKQRFTELVESHKNHRAVLLMSSGNFGGLDVDEFGRGLV